MSVPSSSERQHYVRELIERRREDFVLNRTREELEGIRAGLNDQISVSDPQVVEDLMALGFTCDTVAVLPFIPLIQVAWADGGVSGRESRQILEHAVQSGQAFGGAAYRLIDMLLSERPSDDFMTESLFVLRNWYQGLPAAEASQASASLLDFARVVAEASGGVLGLFGDKIDDRERETLARIEEVFGKDGEALLNDLTRTDDADAT